MARPGFYGAYAYGSPFYSYGYPYYYGYPAYGYPIPRRTVTATYGAYAPYGYGYGGYSGQPYGGLRIDLPQRDAEVYVDGYFVGTVDNFDGRSATGQHRSRSASDRNPLAGVRSRSSST